MRKYAKDFRRSFNKDCANALYLRFSVIFYNF